jgi:hypothetical protein
MLLLAVASLPLSLSFARAFLGELMRLPLLYWAGPIPECADADVQVEDTEQLAAAPDESL